MNIFERIERRIMAFMASPGAELGRLARFVRFNIQLWPICLRRLRQHNAHAMSAALSFRTIFTLVPSLVLALAILAAVGVSEQNKANLRHFLDEMGFSYIMVERVEEEFSAAATRPATLPAALATTSPAPATQTRPARPHGSGIVATAEDRQVSLAVVIERQVGRLQEKLTFGVIGPVGVVVMIWTALTLLTTIERCLNRIFGAPRSRSVLRRVMLYWSAVTLGPIILVAASYSGNRLIESVRAVPVLSWTLGAVGWAGPLIIGIALLAALYKLMPNTHVRYRSAIGGAVIAVPLWRLAMWGFQLYVQKVAPYSVYGALGLLPLFLLWINLSWYIFLFGAELAQTAANLEQMELAESVERTVLGPGDLLAAAVAVGQAFVGGRGPLSLDAAAKQLRLPRLAADRVLHRLAEQGVVAPTGEEPSAWLLARPAEQIALAEIIELAPPSAAPADQRYSPAVAESLAKARAKAGSALAELRLGDLL